jgi:hypothetical protein
MLLECLRIEEYFAGSAMGVQYLQKLGMGPLLVVGGHFGDVHRSLMKVLLVSEGMNSWAFQGIQICWLGVEEAYENHKYWYRMRSGFETLKW